MSKLGALLGVCLFCVIMAAVPVHAAKHALLIGIADYKGSGFSSLDGTINDLELVRGVLVEKFKFQENKIRIMKDAEASHTAIRKAFAELSRKVGKNDVVYIHFSGHGSLTPDLSGKKKSSSVGGQAYDSTWVSYGSRVKSDSKQTAQVGEPDLDNYDILDVEVGEWLAPIYAKTDNVVFVSDSCHSGNMTRGEAPKVRAIPVDMRPHPLSKHIFSISRETGVIVGAAREDQQAGEFFAPDSKSYGLFTWHWAQALNQTLPGDTWDDAFKRTIALIGANRDNQQHPQLEGTFRRSVFGGDFPPPVLSVSISAVSDDGNEVRLKAGSAAGITKGSSYKKKGGEDLFEIASTQPFGSVGKVLKGRFTQGDLVVEETHVYPYTPQKIFVKADLGVDAKMADSLRAAAGTVPGYEVAQSQSQADVMVMVIRPKRKDGAFVYANKLATLPAADPDAKPEVWVLTPDEKLTREKLQMQPDTEERAIEVLVDNLKKMSRIREIIKIGADGNGGVPLVELIVSHYSPSSACTGDAPACFKVPGKGTFALVSTEPSIQMQSKQIKKGDILSFKVKNISKGPLYCYLLDITPGGKISAVFPGPQDSDSMVLVEAKSERDFSDLSGLEIEDSGEDTLKLLVTESPIDVRLFEQGIYMTRGEKKGSENPLESFLSRSMGNATRGTFRMKPNQWGAVQFSVVGN